MPSGCHIQYLRGDLYNVTFSLTEKNKFCVGKLYRLINQSSYI